ncbi:MAG: ROK family protein [Verrucomicrobiota bacterium]
MDGYLLGIDLGGSSIKGVTVTDSGDVLSRRNLDFPVAQAMAWAGGIRQVLSELEAERGQAASAIGLAAPGLAAENGRSIAYMPGRLSGLEGLDWTDHLRSAAVIPVLNDAHAALLGEVWVGAAARMRQVLMLTLGTGVGGAAMVDGHLLRGHIGRAGHLGHICLDPHGPIGITRLPGTLEHAIGNYSIRERSGGRFASTHDLIAAHSSGDPGATEVWLKSVRALGCAVASLINVLDPQAVIIGGGVTRAGEALFRPLREVMDEVEWRPGDRRVQVMPARLGEYAGALGAAFEAKRRRDEGEKAM